MNRVFTNASARLPAILKGSAASVWLHVLFIKDMKAKLNINGNGSGFIVAITIKGQRSG